MNPIKLTIIDGDANVANNLASFLQNQGQIELILTTPSIAHSLDNMHADHSKPDVILLDIHIPERQAIHAIPDIKIKAPNSNIIMLTLNDNHDEIFDSLSAGASAFHSKEEPLHQLYECILTVHKGGSHMTPGVASKVINYFDQHKAHDLLSARHMDIVNGIVDGLSYKMVGDRLGISVDTVRTHIMHIYRSLNIHSKGELIRWALDKEKRLLN
jgi:DNA-binding NarL/FixJ family response regulator